MSRASTSVVLLGTLLLACSSEAETPAADAAAGPAAVEAPAASDAAAKAEAPKPDVAPAGAPAAAAPDGPLIAHAVKTLDGTEQSLGDYRGKALLIVNTASECGFTPQYAGLQELYGRYKDRGLVVLGFPSNDFGAQEPGTHEEIQAFVSSKYAVDFPMFEKLATKGPEQAPLYATLTTETGEGIAGEVEWNFTKFLVDPQGRVVDRFDPAVKPMDDKVTAAIERVLPSGD
jgi:glutathione peroxidase